MTSVGDSTVTPQALRQAQSAAARALHPSPLNRLNQTPPQGAADEADEKAAEHAAATRDDTRAAFKVGMQTIPGCIGVSAHFSPSPSPPAAGAALCTKEDCMFPP